MRSQRHQTHSRSHKHPTPEELAEANGALVEERPQDSHDTHHLEGKDDPELATSRHNRDLNYEQEQRGRDEERLKIALHRKG